MSTKTKKREREKKNRKKRKAKCAHTGKKGARFLFSFIAFILGFLVNSKAKCPSFIKGREIESEDTIIVVSCVRHNTHEPNEKRILYRVKK